jgi:hypothetical protein
MARRAGERSSCRLRPRCWTSTGGLATARSTGGASRYADPWPHTRLDLGVPPARLFKAVPCNHGSLTEGQLARAAEVFCAQAGIPVYRCDDAAGLDALLRDRQAGRVGREARDR